MREVRRARARARGAVIVEYAFLLTAVAIPTMLGISLGGAAMIRDYNQTRDAILRPMP